MGTELRKLGFNKEIEIWAPMVSGILGRSLGFGDLMIKKMTKSDDNQSGENDDDSNTNKENVSVMLY